LTSIHRVVREPIGVRIEVAADVLEPHALEARDERSCRLIQRLQSWMLHPVLALHLLDEQQRIRSDRDARAAVGHSVLERGKQSSILRDVVGCRADRLTELVDERPIRMFDADAIACRAGVAAGSAVDVGDDVARCERSGGTRLERRRGDACPEWKRGIGHWADWLTRSAEAAGAPGEGATK